MIIVSKALMQVICAEGEKSYPNECCGVLLGRRVSSEHAELLQILPIENAKAQEEQYHRFIITAEDYLQAELTARIQGVDVIGFYHSHPDHPSIPSDFDREHALPYYAYIIVAVAKGTAQTVTSWRLTLDRQHFLPDPIKSTELTHNEGVCRWL